MIYGVGMKTIYEALAPIFAESETAKEQGTKFEAACVYYLFILTS